MNRNSPCPCGSGKKYKRCCGKKVTQSASKHKAKLEKKPNEIVIKPMTNKKIKLSSDEEQEIRNLLHQRSKLIAIKRVIDITGCDLKTSINYIESFLIAHEDESSSGLRRKEIMFTSQIELSTHYKPFYLTYVTY